MTLLNSVHREALEYDLITLGLRIDDVGTDALTWRDLWVVARQAPATSALFRSTQPDVAVWGVSEQLQARIADGIGWLVWAKSKDGAHNRNRPKPIPRPGIKPTQEENVITGRAVSLDTMAKRLGWQVHEGGKGKS